MAPEKKFKPMSISPYHDRGVLELAGSLRHISVDLDLTQGADLRGIALMDVAHRIEVMAALGINPDGFVVLVDIAMRAGKTAKDFKSENGMEILEIHAQEGRNVVATALTTGPIMRLFTTTKACWLSRPTYLDSKTGFRITISGTIDGVRAYRKELDTLVPGDLNLRISRTLLGPAGRGPAMSPRRREVMEMARSMGYYDTPRKCSQRELAERLDIRQATVAEHLQRAERDLVAFWLEQQPT